jgi:hypothetical protein
MKTIKSPAITANPPFRLILAPPVKIGELEIVGTRYDLEDGKVEIVP